MSDLIKRLKRLVNSFPKHFWFLCMGLFVSVSGISLVWPFITIYLREQLSLPMVEVTTLITIQSFMSILSTLIIGPIMDRFGRKRFMVFSLFMNGLTFFFFSIASTYTHFLILMLIRGFLAPIFRVGANTMVADLIPVEKRLDAYSVLRTATNVGFAIGPAVGGLLVAESFQLAVLVSMVILVAFSAASVFLLKETLPQQDKEQNKSEKKPGYLEILGNKFFRTLLIGDTFVKMGMILMFVLLSVYVKENFGILENQFGLIITVNAIMAILLQIPATQFTRKRRPTSMLMLGAFFYGIGILSVAFGSHFIHFAVSMAVMTVGEVIFMPVATNLVSEISPPDQRGSYMGLYSLTMGVARSISPMVGGILNDQIAPAAMWYGGGIMGFVSMLTFFILQRLRSSQKRTLKHLEG